jgi:hypothetical protein
MNCETKHNKLGAVIILREKKQISKNQVKYSKSFYEYNNKFV